MPTSADSPTHRREVNPLGLWPVAIIALGCPDQPGDRLMSLQAGVGRLIALLCQLRRPRLPRIAQAAQAFRHFI